MPVASDVCDGKGITVPALLGWLAYATADKPEFDAYLVLPSAQGDGR